MRPAAQCLNDLQARWGIWDQYLADLVLAPASATGLTVTVDASAGTFTRSIGSYLEDGFAVGQRVNWTGFAAGGNNVSRREIADVSPLVMTFADTTGLANVTDDAGCAVTAWAGIAGRLDVSSQMNVDGSVSIGDDVAIDGELVVHGPEVVIDGDLLIGGDVVHGEFSLCVSAAAFQPTTGSPSFSSSPEPAWTATGADFLYAVVNLPVGSRVKSISFANTRAAGTLTFETYNHNLSTGAIALIGASLAVTTGTSRAVSAVASVSGDADATLEAGEALYIVAALGASGNALHGVLVTYDRP